jgi:hypothetical protein
VVQISRSGSDYIIGSSILPPNSAATINGVIVSYDPSSPDGIVFKSESTISLAPSQATTIFSPSNTFYSLEVSRIDDQNIVVGGQTLTAGHVASFNDVSISVDSSGGIVIDGSSVLSLSDGGQTAVIAAAPTPAPGALGIHRESGNYIIGGHTLTPGQEMTVNGVEVSLAAEAEAVVVAGSKTISLSDGGSTKVGAITMSTGTDGQLESVIVVDGSTITLSGTGTSRTGMATGEGVSRTRTSTSEGTERGENEGDLATTAGDGNEPSATETGGADRLGVGMSWSAVAALGFAAIALL